MLDMPHINFATTDLYDLNTSVVTTTPAMSGRPQNASSSHDVAALW